MCMIAAAVDIEAVKPYCWNKLCLVLSLIMCLYAYKYTT